MKYYLPSLSFCRICIPDDIIGRFVVLSLKICELSLCFVELLRRVLYSLNIRVIMTFKLTVVEDVRSWSSSGEKTHCNFIS